MALAFGPAAFHFRFPFQFIGGRWFWMGGVGAVGVAGRVELTFLARHVDFAFNCFIVRQVLAITQSHSHT